MIPWNIRDYLVKAQVRFSPRGHAVAVGGQALAAMLDVSGWRVAKSVIVDVDGKKWIAVIPAAEVLEPAWLAAALNAKSVRLVDEPELAGLFPDCELGAEPPFGRLYGLPVVVDARLSTEPTLVIRAGTHDECIELSFGDFERLEQPRVARIGNIQVGGRRREAELRP
jgi:Ala-tRNA(Pro) deacylase